MSWFGMGEAMRRVEKSRRKAAKETCMAKREWRCLCVELWLMRITSNAYSGVACGQKRWRLVRRMKGASIAVLNC